MMLGMRNPTNRWFARGYRPIRFGVVGPTRVSNASALVEPAGINGDTRPTTFTGVKGTTGAGDPYFVYDKE